jgi:hypothetical protein
MISSRRRPAPSVDRKPSHFTGRPTRLAASPCKNLFAVGGMTLQKTRTTRHVPLAGGGMTLQIGWRHDLAKITQKWRHEPANWQTEVHHDASRRGHQLFEILGRDDVGDEVELRVARRSKS